jgi:ATP-binding cassette, subfamily B, bacterial PglK
LFSLFGTSWSFLNGRERKVWAAYTFFRSALSILDLIGVLAVGVVAASIALFLTEGSDPDRTVAFSGIEVPAANISTLPLYAGVILALFLVKALLAIVLSRRSAIFLAGVDARAARSLSEKLFDADLSVSQKKSRDEAIYAVQMGTSSAFSGLLNSASTAISESVLFLLISLGFFLVNPVATLGILTYFGLVALAINFFLGGRIQRFGVRSVKNSVRTNVHVSDLISVLREAAVSGKRQDFFRRIYEAKLNASRHLALQNFLSGMPRYIIESALLVGFALLIVFQAASNDLVSSATTVSVFLAGGFRLTAALLPLQSALLAMRGANASARTALDELVPTEIKDERPRSEDSTITSDKVSDSAIGVTMTGVSFSHPLADSPAVQGVNLQITPGTKVALIGASGSGKSTVADLMCGLLHPQKGQVQLSQGGEQFDPRALFGQIAYVPQRPSLISGSIASNVALGTRPEEIDLEKVQNSLVRVGLWSVVEKLPDGLHTEVGNLRDNLSGGEIQRVGLARALYLNPRLLIMDEATSALDATSESEVSQVLDSIKGEVTLLVIAHRLNTVVNADKVFLMKSGTIADSGSFQELVSRNPDLREAADLFKLDYT